MKYFIIAVFIVSFVACKKTEKLKPEVLPDTYVDPSYIGRMESHLNIGVGSNGPVDSTFRFNSALWENGANAPVVGFKKVIYNGYVANTIDQGVRFLDFANHSNWNLQSSYIGNFTHTDNSPTPLIGNVTGLVPPTFSGGELNLDLQNISNADQILVTAFDDGMNILGSSQTFMVEGRQNLSLAFTANVLYLPLNTDIRITVSLWKFNKLKGNNYEIDFGKVTNYIYRTKKTS